MKSGLPAKLLALLHLLILPSIVQNCFAQQGYIGASTYVPSIRGGSLTDIQNGITYIVGSLNYSTTMTNGSVLAGGFDLTLTKMDKNGNVIYSRYYGGSGDETPSDMKVVNGEVYIVGTTTSSNLPVVPAASTTYGGSTDYFVTKFGTDGNIIYSRYLGGTSSESSAPNVSINVLNGEALIVGATRSGDYPVTDGSILHNSAGGNTDIVYTKLNSSGGLSVSSYIGGTGSDVPRNTTTVLYNSYLYVMEDSWVNNFPITDGIAPTNSKHYPYFKLNPASAVIEYCTYEIYNNYMLADSGYIYLSNAGVVKYDAVTNSKIYSNYLSEMLGSNLAFVSKEAGTINLVYKAYSSVLSTTDGSVHPGPTGGYCIYYKKMDAATGAVTASKYLPVQFPNSASISSASIKFINDKFYIGGSASYFGDQLAVNNGTTNPPKARSLFQNGEYFAAYDATGNMSFSTFLAGATDQPGNWGDDQFSNMIVKGNEVYLFGASGNLDFPVTNTSTVAQFNIGTMVRIDLCPTIPVGPDFIVPASQNVCKSGLVQLLVAPEFSLESGGSSGIPTLYRNGVSTPQYPVKATYQWQQSSNAAGPWTDIENATQKNYAPQPTNVDIYFRRITRNKALCGGDIISTSDVASVIVTVNTAPRIDAGGTLDICPGNSVTLGGSPTATGQGGATITSYLWTPVTAVYTPANTDANPTVTPAVSTLYTVTVTDDNGCQQRGQSSVNVYAANAGPDVSFCAGTSGVRIGGDPVVVPGATYSWVSNPVGFTSTDAQPIVDPFVETTYTLTLTIPKSDGSTCSTTDDVKVTPIGAPTVSDFAGNDITVCLGSTATIGVVIPADATLFPITAVSQSSVNTYTGTVANLNDVIYTTGARTASAANSWIKVDIGSVNVINEVQLAAITSFYLAGRSIQVSEDDITWTTVVASIPSASFSYLTSYNFASIKARYVRIYMAASGTIDVSEFRVRNAFAYTWAPGSYLSSNSTVTTTFQPGSYQLPNPDPYTYYLTARKDGCAFVDSVKAYVITANAGVDGCGARYIGTADATPYIDEVYSWTKITAGAGTSDFTGPTNTSLTTVSSATVATTFRLTATYNGVTCTDDVVVPACGCELPVISIQAPNTCPSYDLNGGHVALTASRLRPAIYTWSPADGLSTTTGAQVFLTDNVPHTYTVTATNPLDPADFCTSTISVNDPVWSLPVFTAHDGNVCAGVPVSIGEPSVASYTYLWTGAGLNFTNISDPVSTTNSTTIYTVNVTDIGSGCTFKDTAVVTVPNLPINGAGDDMKICGATTIQLGRDPIPGVSYVWTPAASYSPGSNVANPTVPVAGPAIFHVVATDDATGCFVEDDVTVTAGVPVAPFTLAPLADFCPSVAGAIALPAGPAAMTTYEWSPRSKVINPNSNGPAATTTNPRPQTATTYTLTVTNASGCNATASVTLNPLTTLPDAGGDKVICLSDGSVSIGSASNPTGGGITYSWSPITGLSDATSPNPVFTPGAAGITTFTLTKTVAGCAFTDKVSVTVNDFTIPVMVSPTVCNSFPVQIGTTPVSGASYYWTPSTGLSNPKIANPIATITATTEYTLTAVGGNGCIATQAMEVSLTGNHAPVITFADIPGCLNSADVLAPVVSPAGDYSYSWTPNNGTLSDVNIANPVVTFMTQGIKTYNIKVTNTTTGCSANLNINVNIFICGILPVKLENFSAEPIGTSVALNWLVSDEADIKKYEIEFSTDGFNKFNPIGSLNASNNGTYRLVHNSPVDGVNFYRLKITDKSGRITYSEIRKVNFYTKSSVFIYPNPVGSIINIKLKGAMINKPSTIILMTMDGRIAMQRNIKITSQYEVLNIGGLIPGNYIVHIVSANEVINSRIEVIK